MKSLFLRKFLIFSLLLIGGLGAPKAFADHISAAELWADYIGSGPTDMTYRVTIRFYRICAPGYGGAPNLQLGPTEYGVSVQSASLGFNQTLVMQNIVLHMDANNQPVYEDTLDNLCPAFSAINSCRVPANVSYSGYTTRTYVDTVTVPGRSSDLKFVWSSCCRLLSYTNINGPGNPQFYMEAGINNLVKYNNSTPRYNGQPFTFCCTNQPSSLSNLPTDPDGDSLITYNLVPQQTATTNVQYNTGYTATVPTGTTGYYNVGPVSGKASFMAVNSGRYVLGFRTEDWDRASGQRLGYASRDLTITVLPCTNLPPYIDSLPNGLTGVRNIDTTGGEVVLSACPQSPLSFTVNAHSNNQNGLIYMRPAGALPPGMVVTPTVTGGTGFVTVNWTPTAADIGTHVVSILAVDSTCAVGQEITLRSEFTFTVIVRPGLDAGPDLLACPLGDRPVKLGTNGDPNAHYTWMGLDGNPAEFLSCTDCPNPLANPTRVYTYVVHTDEAYFVCKTEDTVTVNLDLTNGVTTPQNELIVCRPGYVQLQAVPFGPAPVANLPCGTNGPVTCAVADEKTAIIGTGTNPAFVNANTPFYSASTYHKYQFIIPKQDLLNAGLYSGTLNGISFLHINPTVLGAAPLENLQISLGCTYASTLPDNATNNDFVTGTTPVATVASYTLTANSWNQIPFSTPYSWDTSLNLLVDICMGPMTAANTGGLDPVAMMPGRAIQRYDNAVNVCGGNAATVQSYPQRPVVRFNYCASPDLPFTYAWRPGSYLQDSTAQNPTAYIAKSTGYAVYTVGRNGCRVRDSLIITVPEHHLSALPQDSSVCLGQPAFLRAYGGQAYHWFQMEGGLFTDASGTLSCTDCQFPTATPKATTQYAVVFDNEIGAGNAQNPTYSTGCPDTLFTTVKVLPLPPVNVVSQDTTIGYGHSVQLFVRGAANYAWTPVGSLSDPNSPAPVATPDETTTYIATGLDSNGCAYRDTVKVTVVYQDHILVPTAFSPNGDGRNDVFKVINPTYHRLMEFRVFNRWGQEIFSTTDINSGWDGTWKNVEQPIGNYQYLIRVGSPDGRAEIYKGEVTLVR